MNKSLLIRRFTKAAQSYDNDAKAQQIIAHKMIQLLRSFVEHDVNSVVEIGCGTGIYSRLLIDTFHPHLFVMNDICDMEQQLTGILSNENYSFTACDAEHWDFPQQVDLLTSCSTFQWFGNFDLFVRKVFSALNKNGIFAFSTFGEENLCEINQLTSRSLNYIAAEELSKILLHAGFSILHTEEEKITLLFDSPKDVLLHLKRTGVNGISSQKWTKSTLQRFENDYLANFSNEAGKVTLTYHPMFFIAQA